MIGAPLMCCLKSMCGSDNMKYPLGTIQRHFDLALGTTLIQQTGNISWVFGVLYFVKRVTA